jgi:quercetin dioxygenase-like cupin family protein
MRGTNRRRAEKSLGTLLAMGLGVLTISALAAPAIAAEGDVARPAWQRGFEAMNPMIKMAPAYGDRSKGAHGTFGQFAPNFAAPWHTHSETYDAVVIRGVMTNPFAGEDNPPKMGPGSYWHVPAKSVHTTACISDTPCEFYFHSKGAFDFIPVK